jgi:tetratricopeptide (TPR) repeat protein
LGRLAAKNENHKLASKHFGIAVNVGKKNSSSKLSEKVVEAMLGEGRAHTLLGNFRNAATCYQPLVSLPGKSGVDGKIGMSKLLLETGHAQEAANMVMTALEPPHQEHVEGLLLYATIAERHEKNEEALSVLLRLVVTNKDFSPIKKLIAKVFAKEGMITLLQSIVPLNAASASAYAFLATVSKDHGAVDAACELLLLAHQTVPSNHSYALNYVHALELQGDMSVAWNALLRHLSVNTHLTMGGVSNASFLAAAADGRSDSEWNISWVSSAAEPYAECATTGFSGPTSKQSLLLNDELLDVLALWFAGVKIRYLMGASVVSLIACIEAARLTSSKPLHNTTIRNEHAYYCCVAQLKAAHCLTQSSIVVPSSGDDVVYVCGDSHSLSPAWQKFTSSEEKEVTLSPKLVTGLKHWHLRPEGDFYPKIHFERVVKSIPDGAKVVFIFGEIDCREGILFAVQKDRYETVEEGMRCTLAFYLTVLERLAATRRFTVLVHPIVPVLDETRSLVVTYNSLLRSAVLKSKSLRWLGGDEDTLFNGLLTEDGKLATSFVLDGTHLHPSYISLLAPAITNALQR